MPFHELTSLIERHFAGLSPELQRAARWVREHPTALGLQSMRQSAQAAGVAPATMTRLAQALGLGGFEGLRAPVVAHLSGKAHRASPINEASSRGERAPSALAHLISAQAGNLASVDRNSSDAFRLAAQAILDARHVCFLGLRASFGIAHHLHYTCQWLRDGAWLASDVAGAWQDRLTDMDESDVLVVVSQAPYTRQVVTAAQGAKAKGIPVLALTDSPLSPLASAAEWTLLFDADSTAFFHSMTGAQALAEALMNEVAMLGGSSVAKRLSARQAMHQDARTYWDRGHRQAKRSDRSNSHASSSS